jgi:large subunit ribosomal protein L19
VLQYTTLFRAIFKRATKLNVVKIIMNTVVSGIEISSVNVEDRKNLGLKAGDTVRVHQKIEDKGKTRIQIFEGLVLARKHGSEPGATFTVRKVVDGIGVEKIFPLFSPLIDKIEIVRRSTVRKSKLYYIREKVAREIRRQMRRMHLMNLASESDIEAKAEAEKKKAEESETKEPEEIQAMESPAEEKPTKEELAEAAKEDQTPVEEPVEEEKPTEVNKQEETPEAEETKEEETKEDKKD